MERAAAAVAAEALRAFPDARRFAVVCGNGANGGTDASPRVFSARQGATRRRPDDLAGADVVVDALFGTGFHGAPRPDAAALIDRIGGADCRCFPSTCRPASTPRPARSPARR